MPHIGTPQPAFSVGPPSARQRNAIQMAFRWRADGGPHLNVYWDMQNICNETDSSFEHPKHMFWLRNKKIFFC